MKRTVIEFLIVASLGVAVAIVANSARSSGGLRWSKNYFAKIELPTRVTKTPPTPESDQVTSHLEHQYNNISVKQVRALFDEPGTAAGVNIFVDARNDEDFDEGHIPGAIQFNHYEPELFIDTVIEAAATADSVVVYCNGGDCEDSIFVCGDLIELDISFDTIHLFAGGWKAWIGAKHPVETGATDQ